MNNWLSRGALIPMLALSACVSAPPAVTPTSPSPSPSATAVASATPTGQSPTPAASPSAAPAAGAFNWSAGRLLKSYNFTRVDGIAFNPYLNQIYVLDGLDEAVTSRGLQLRKFQADGAYLSTVSLAMEGEAAPDAVDAIAFDPAGTPVYSHRDALGAFALRKLFTSTVAGAGRYPLAGTEWAGPTALHFDREFLSVALLGLDPEKRDEARRTGVTPSMTGGNIQFGVAEEGEPSQVLFQVPDPFAPTRAMAFASTGDLYLAGQTGEAGFAVKRLKKDQSLQDIGGLADRPFGMWSGPEGDVYLSHETAGAPARLRRVDAGGQLGPEMELRLEAGGFLYQVKGLAFDRQGNPLLTGVGFDADSRRVSGIYTFPR